MAAFDHREFQAFLRECRHVDTALAAAAKIGEQCLISSAAAAALLQLVAALEDQRAELDRRYVEQEDGSLILADGVAA